MTKPYKTCNLQVSDIGEKETECGIISKNRIESTCGELQELLWLKIILDDLRVIGWPYEDLL